MQKSWIGVDATEQGNDHDGTNDGVAVRAEDRSAAVPRAKSFPAIWVMGKNVKHGRIEQQINGHDGEHAAENGAGNVAAGIAHLFAEIDDAVPAVDGVNDRLQARAKWRRPAATRWAAMGLSGGCRRRRRWALSAEKKASNNEDHESAGFHRGGDQLRAAAPADAAPLQDEESAR